MKLDFSLLLQSRLPGASLSLVIFTHFKSVSKRLSSFLPHPEAFLTQMLQSEPPATCLIQFLLSLPSLLDHTADTVKGGFRAVLRDTTKKGHHAEKNTGLGWRQLHRCPRLVGLFWALLLTFPCRCWDFWPFHRAAPRCLWVLLIVMECSSRARVCAEMHFYCVWARACVFQEYDPVGVELLLRVLQSCKAPCRQLDLTQA